MPSTTILPHGLISNETVPVTAAGGCVSANGAVALLTALLDVGWGGKDAGGGKVGAGGGACSVVGVAGGGEVDAATDARSAGAAADGFGVAGVAEPTEVAIAGGVGPPAKIK